MPVKIAVLKETRPHEQRVALVPAVADKLAKLGAQLHLQAGAGTAVKLADQAYKNVQLHADPIEMVRDADIVLSVQPPDPAIVARDEGRRDPDLLRLRAQRAGADAPAARSQDHLLRDGAGAAHHARAGDGCAVESGRARRLLRGAARRDQHRTHVADDDHRRRLDPPGARAGDGPRRCGPAGARDGAPPRRDDRRLRRAAGDEGAGRIARREVRRHRRRCARRGRLRARADAGRERQGRRGRHQAHPAVRHRHHDRRDSRAGPRRS